MRAGQLVPILGEIRRLAIVWPILLFEILAPIRALARNFMVPELWTPI